MGRSAIKSPVTRVGAVVVISVLLVGAVSWRIQASQQPDAVSGPPETAMSQRAADAGAAREEGVSTASIEDLSGEERTAGPEGPDSAAQVAQQVGDEVVPGVPEEVEKEAPATTAPGPLSGESYTWRDGDRILVVRLEPDLVLHEGDVVSRDDIVAGSGGAREGAAQSADDAVESGGDLLVFRSDEGELMALPGGVLVVLDPGWDAAAVDAFFGRNGIAASRTTALDYVANGFFVETGPGFASLDLANALVGQAGVELSSPNWWKEVFTD